LSGTGITGFCVEASPSAFLMTEVAKIGFVFLLVKGSQLSASIFFFAISCLMFSSAFSNFRFLLRSLMSAMLLIFSLRALSRCLACSSN
jgi:hypothetical protein